MHFGLSEKENSDAINKPYLGRKTERSHRLSERTSIKNIFTENHNYLQLQELENRSNSKIHPRDPTVERTTRGTSCSLEQPRKSFRAQPMPNFFIAPVIYKSQKPLTIPKQFNFASEK